jgi:tetratricopeptide (TPR) repeat protein
LLEFANVSTRIILLLLVAVSLAPAETIRLKNGRKILADRVRENNGRIEYEVGDNVFAIPQSLVEGIDAGGVPLVSNPAAEVPAFTPSEELDPKKALTFSVIRHGRVDPEALAAVERSGNASLAAMGFFNAARHEYEHGNREQSRFYLGRALTFLPDNTVVLIRLATVLVQLGRAAEAVQYAERAARLAPDSPDAHAALGMAYFSSDRSQEAVRAWKRSLQLRADPTVEKFLAKAERELTAEARYAQRESGHFTLRYEGSHSAESLGRSVLAVLESQYDDLVRDLGVAPRASIPVILYTDQAFFDVTQAPAWAGAVNDGKLRLPIDGVTSVTPEMARVLKHELVHSFVNYLSRGRSPQWLQEGLAQLLEPRTSAEHGRVLALLFARGRHIPLKVLEGSFMRLSTTQAQVAYAESLVAAEYIRDTYGLSDLQRILARIGEGSSPESAVRATVHSDYAGLEDDIARYLKSRYGVD